MLTVTCCDRGAPGATTSALALGAASGGPAIVVEADPYGGDLALRCRTKRGGVFPEAPTVLTVAVAARTEFSNDLVTRYAQPLNDQVSVIPGHLTAEQGASVSDWTPLARSLRASAATVVADVGRVHAGSPSLPIAAAADVLVVVGRADMSSVVHLRERLVPLLAEVRRAPPVVLPVLVTDRRHGPRLAGSLRDFLQASAVAPFVTDTGWLAWDPDAVARLESGSGFTGLVRTALLPSSTRVVAQTRSLVHAAGGPEHTPVRASPQTGSSGWGAAT